MAPDKLTPSDPRVQHKTATLNGIDYHYLLANPPSAAPRATIFLIHGFPDLSFGWRYQIPALLSLNLRVIAPDMIGYGQTSTPSDLTAYTIKRAADDLALLAAHLSTPHIILLGHDWGGQIAWRTAHYHPTLVTAVLSICTPYLPPSPTYLPLETLVAKVLPNFSYQLQFQSPELPHRIASRAGIRAFLNAIYGGARPDGTRGFNARDGVVFDVYETLELSPLLSDAELDFYADAFAKTGLAPPLTWYRTRELNWRDEKAWTDDRLGMPALFVRAARDVALPPAMAKGMEKYFDDLTVHEVDSSHWALWEKPEEVNAFVTQFVEGVLGRKAASAL